MLSDLLTQAVNWGDCKECCLELQDENALCLLDCPSSFLENMETLFQRKHGPKKQSPTKEGLDDITSPWRNNYEFALSACPAAWEQNRNCL